jgi:hypothetical protein
MSKQIPPQKCDSSTEECPEAQDLQNELDGLRSIADQDLRHQIRELLKLPMNKRTHFLRVLHPGGGSHL